MTFTFDYRQNSQSFLGWVLITLLAGKPATEFEKLTEATNNFNNVEMQILINGIEIDTERFILRLEETLENEAKRAAKEMFENVDAFESLEDELYKVRCFLSTWHKKIAENHGIEIFDD